MAGIAQVVLTDNELDDILDWYARGPACLPTERELSLAAKLRSIRSTLDCDCSTTSCAALPHDHPSTDPCWAGCTARR